jgi:hemolysin D
VAEYRHALSDELAKAVQKANGLAQDLIKAEQKTRLQVLTAPVDGVVQQLAVHTVGGVVTPAQALLVVVPRDSRLEIEAMVSNRDIGFVQPGQKAEIKIDTFNFTRYGLLHGEVLSVSQDAIILDRQQDRSNDRGLGTQNETSEPKGQELNYSARISLGRTQMHIDERIVNLSPGMAVTVEIKTGSRTILSYLLSPLLRWGRSPSSSPISVLKTQDAGGRSFPPAGAPIPMTWRISSIMRATIVCAAVSSTSPA